MKFGEIIAPSIKELFIQKIEGMILSGALKPGERLPTERELADEMNISKTIVHEGIRELSRLGFLDVVSRKGVTVADYAQNGNLDTLMAIMKYNGRLSEHFDCQESFRCTRLFGMSCSGSISRTPYPRGYCKVRAAFSRNLQGKGRWHPCPFTGDVPLSPHDHFFKWKYHYTSDPQRFFSGRTFLLGGLYPDRRRGCLARTVRTLFRLYPKRKRERAG